MFVSEQVQNERMDICKKCPWFSKLKICKKCGCVMPAKTKLKSARCPDGRWGRDV